MERLTKLKMELWADRFFTLGWVALDALAVVTKIKDPQAYTSIDMAIVAGLVTGLAIGSALAAKDVTANIYQLNQMPAVDNVVPIREEHYGGNQAS